MPIRYEDPTNRLQPELPPDYPPNSPLRPGGWLSDNPETVDWGFLQFIINAMGRGQEYVGRGAAGGRGAADPALDRAFDADMRAGGRGGAGPDGAGPVNVTTYRGYTDPWSIREGRTGVPVGGREGAPETYTRAPYVKGQGAGPSGSDMNRYDVGEKIYDKAGNFVAAPQRKAAGAGLGGAGGAGGGAPAGAKAPVAPMATGWEEEFYRTHGRFPSEWDYRDKLWSENFARQNGRPPNRDEWVGEAKRNLYNPGRPPEIPEFAPGWGLDTGFGPYRPAPMGAVPEEVQVPGQKPGFRWEKPTGTRGRRGEAPAEEAPARAPAAKEGGAWGQLIPEAWDTATTNQVFGQWLAEGGSGEPDEWASHLQAIGAA